ncbi:4-(cytidine 5'-diphospho)-2-C-methyl-D-erythritol kinase [Gemmatimonadota bacterium]
MRLTAPAKVNLGLRLLRKREDGYHEIETFFHTLAWSDELLIEPAGEITLSVVTAPDSVCPELLQEVPHDSSNLVWKAAILLGERLDMSGVSVTLIKRIPPGAGLGGGSSDAAAALKGMIDLFELNVSDEELLNMAVDLGADVPFLLSGGCALAEGIGETLTAVSPVAEVPALILLHPFMVSTQWAYRSAGLSEEKTACYGGYLAEKGDMADILSSIDLRNDLEEPVIKAYPEIIDSLSALRDSGAFFVSMTGSGSAVFGLFHSDDDAAEAARNLVDGGFSVIETVLR